MKIHCFSSQSHQLINNIQVLCVTHDSYLTFFSVGDKILLWRPSWPLKSIPLASTSRVSVGIMDKHNCISYLSNFFIYLLKLFYKDDFFFLQHRLFTWVMSVQTRVYSEI